MRFTWAVLLFTALTASAQLSNDDCTGCHGDHPDVAKFSSSVHAAQPCTGCHTAVKDYDHAENPASVQVNRFDIPKMCASCHDAKEYVEGVHG